jgi:hypothetical protein
VNTKKEKERKKKKKEKRQRQRKHEIIRIILNATLSGNNFTIVVPNPTMLNKVPNGKLRKNNCNAFFA